MLDVWYSGDREYSKDLGYSDECEYSVERGYPDEREYSGELEYSDDDDLLRGLGLLGLLLEACSVVEFRASLTKYVRTAPAAATPTPVATFLQKLLPLSSFGILTKWRSTKLSKRHGVNIDMITGGELIRLTLRNIFNEVKKKAC